jgi:hypothetical protein
MRPPKPLPSVPPFPWLLMVLSLASCEGCYERTPGVCCISDSECARLGLPPGSVGDYSCGQDHVCRDFYCVAEEGPDASAPDVAVDAALDAPSRRCNPTAPFGTPTRLANVNSALEELDMVLTGDELTAFFVRSNGSELNLQTSSRPSAEDSFPTPTVSVSIVAIDTAYDATRLSVTSDGLALYFRAGNGDVFVASRQNTSAAFTSASRAYANGMAIYAHVPKISADSMTLYLSGPSQQLRAATRAGAHDSFIDQRFASTHEMTDFAISADELTLYYSNFPYPDVFVSTRASKNVPFGVGVPVSNVSTSDSDVPLDVTADGCLLYLRSNRPGSHGANDFWVTRRAQ